MVNRTRAVLIILMVSITNSMAFAVEAQSIDDANFNFCTTAVIKGAHKTGGDDVMCNRLYHIPSTLIVKCLENDFEVSSKADPTFKNECDYFFAHWNDKEFQGITSAQWGPLAGQWKHMELPLRLKMLFDLRIDRQVDYGVLDQCKALVESGAQGQEQFSKDCRYVDMPQPIVYECVSDVENGELSKEAFFDKCHLPLQLHSKGPWYDYVVPSSWLPILDKLKVVTQVQEGEA